MGRYRAEAWVPLTPIAAFDLWIDPVRSPQWSEQLVRVFDMTTDVATPGATFRLDYGALKRQSTVLTSRRGEVYRVRSSGGGWKDETTTSFAERDGGTLVTCEVDLQMGWGLIGRLYERRLGAHGAEKKIRDEIERFSAVALRTVPEAPPGTVFAVDCGAGFRLAQLLADDDDILHIRLFPGVEKHRPTTVTHVPDVKRGAPDPLTVAPLAPRLSWITDLVAIGQPLLALDGGHGVPHVAITRGAFADSMPTVVGRVAVDPSVSGEVDSWRAHGHVVAGRDPDFAVGSMVSYAAEGGADGVTAYGVAKVLKVEGGTVHLRLYSDVWPERPSTVDPWTLQLEPAWSDRPGVGHVPVSLFVYMSMSPEFMRLAMVGADELAGYREWKDAGQRRIGLRDIRRRDR